MKEFEVKDFFCCNYCKNICRGNCYSVKERMMNGDLKEEDDEYQENIDLVGRKFIIGCLGKYCEKPCKLNQEDAYKDIDTKTWVESVKSLGKRVNELIEENRQLQNKLYDKTDSKDNK